MKGHERFWLIMGLVLIAGIIKYVVIPGLDGPYRDSWIGAFLAMFGIIGVMERIFFRMGEEETKSPMYLRLISWGYYIEVLFVGISFLLSKWNKYLDKIKWLSDEK